MGRIYLVRHGESQGNKEGFHQGHIDTQLSDLGIKQAEKISDRLMDENIDLIFSSDLTRALNTAKEINKFHTVEIIQSEDLRDIERGIWEGKKHEKVNFNDLEGDKYNRKPHKGESFIDVANRMNKFLQDYKNKINNKNVLIVSHGVTTKTLIQNIVGLNNEESYNIDAKNTCLTIIDSDNKKIELQTCIKHLEDLKE